MNSTQVTSLLGSIVLALAAAGAGYLAKAHIIPADQLDTVSGAIGVMITGLVTVGIGWYKTKTVSDANLRSAAAQTPGTVMVVTTPAIANSVDHVTDPKVVSVSQAQASLPTAQPTPGKGL